MVFLDNQQKGEILIYQSETGETKIDVFLEDGTVWLTQTGISKLYGTTPQNITKHVHPHNMQGAGSFTCPPL